MSDIETMIDIKTDSLWLMQGDCLERMNQEEWKVLKSNIQEYFI